MSSTTMLPPQAAALAQLVTDTRAIAVDVAETTDWAVRVVTYHAQEDRAPTDPPAGARWWTISCAGTVRESAPTPEQVAA